MKKYFLLISLLSVSFLVSCQTPKPEITGETPVTGKFVSVESKVFDKVKYEPKTKTLVLVFSTGAHYEYKNVPQTIYNGFLDAPFKGGYYHSKIKKQFKGKRLAL